MAANFDVCASGCAYTTIQAAIANANSDDTINVAAGIYTEVGQIVIDKNLSIVGAGKATTSIKSADNTVSSNTSDDLSGWIVVKPSVTFSLSKVTLDGSGKQIAQAIIHHGDGTINDCSIKNIKFTSQSGVGIRIQSTGTVNVLNSDFSEIGRNGILFKDAATSLIDHNTYTGKGLGSWFDYGIEVQFGANVTITNNTISNNLGSLDGYTSSGVSVWDDTGDTVTFSGNTFTNNTAGIAVAVGGAPYGGATDPIVRINAGNIFNNNDVGIDIQNAGADGAPTVSIATSTFSGNTTGIQVPLGMSASNITVHTSSFSGNATSTANLGTGTLDASNNWWGDASGPGSVGLGSGDKVSANVSYKPWCTNLACTTFSSDNPTTTAATGRTSTNATLNGTNGSYDATGHSFWVSLAPFVTTSSTIPADVYSTVDLGAIAPNIAFSAPLTSVTGLPTVTPNTTYYFVAWSNVDGTWYPGTISSFTTADRYTQADFTAFDGVNIGTNGYTVSSGITATYNNGTGTESNPVKLTLTGYAPIVTPWFNSEWTTHNYVAIGINLPASFSGTTVYQADIMRYDDPTNFPNGYYTVGYGSTPLATEGAALGYLNYEFAADSINTKRAGIAKLKVIWTEGTTPEYFTIDISNLSLTDTIAPTIPVLTTPINGVFINNNAPLMQWGDSTDIGGSGVASYDYQVYYNCTNTGDIPGSCSSVTNVNSLSSSEYQAGSTGDGVYYWQVRAKDNVGNFSDWSGLEKVTIDTKAPTLAIANPTADQVTNGRIITINGTATDTNFNYYYCYVSNVNGHEYGARDAACTTTWHAVTPASVLGSVTLPNDLADGNYVVHLIGKDKAGNTTEVTQSFILDNTLPTGSVSYTGGNKVSDIIYLKSIDELNFGAAFTDNQALEHTSYAVWKADSDFQNRVLFCGNWNHAITSLDISGTSASVSGNVKDCSPTGDWSNGSYVIMHIVYDAAGNATYLNNYPGQKFVIDNTWPVITLDGVTSDITVGGTYTELGANATDIVDGVFAATPSGTVNTGAVGTYTITYNATDVAGNIATPVTRTVKVVAAPAGPVALTTTISGNNSDTTGGVTDNGTPTVQGATAGNDITSDNNQDQGVQGATTGDTTAPQNSVTEPAVKGTEDAAASEVGSTPWWNNRVLGIWVWLWLLFAALGFGGGWWYLATRRRNRI